MEEPTYKAIGFVRGGGGIFKIWILFTEKGMDTEKVHCLLLSFMSRFLG